MKIVVNQLGPRQQFLGSNGRRYKLVSKEKAWKEIAVVERADWLECEITGILAPGLSDATVGHIYMQRLAGKQFGLRREE